METESILQKCNGRSVEQLKYTDTYQLLPSVTKWRQISNSKRNLFKNCDMSEISICLQPNQRGCCSFTILKNDTRLLGQKQRTLILSAQQEEGLQVSLSRPCPSPVQEEEQLSRCCTQGSPVSQMRKLRASSASHAKLLTGLLAWLAFAPRKTLPLLCRTANKSALCPRKEVFFSSKDVCYKIILDNILQNKGAETFKTHKDLIASQHWRPYKCIHTMWDRVVRANHFSEGYLIKWEKYLWSTMTYKTQVPTPQNYTHTHKERKQT